MTDNDTQLIAQAIAAQNGSGYDTPSGPSLDLARAFAYERKYKALSFLYLAFRAAYPINTHFFETQIPGKVRSALAEQFSGSGPVEAYDREHPDFTLSMLRALQDPERFVTYMHNVERSIEISLTKP